VPWKQISSSSVFCEVLRPHSVLAKRQICSPHVTFCLIRLAWSCKTADKTLRVDQPLVRYPVESRTGFHAKRVLTLNQLPKHSYERHLSFIFIAQGQDKRGGNIVASSMSDWTPFGRLVCPHTHYKIVANFCLLSEKVKFQSGQCVGLYGNTFAAERRGDLELINRLASHNLIKSVVADY
jgi:hypothetical protein